MTEYPRDQFDDVPEYRGRQGSHRAVAEPAASAGPSGLTWISVAAAFALAVGAVSYVILPGLNSGSGRPDAAAPPASASASSSAAASPTPAPSSGTARARATPSATPTADATASPTATPTADATASPTATPTPTPTPETVDYSLPVEVYNASRVNGLAARARGTLSGSGFRVATAGNWAGFPVRSSAVFYSSHEVTAQAVAARLGLPVVYDGRIPGIAVVVTAGYGG